jgi:HSP20 family protein
MKVDLTEDDKAFRIEAELPGVGPEDIRLEVDGTRVILRAEVKPARNENGYERIVCCERSYGLLSRSFTLPAEVDGGAAKLEFRDGIVRLTLPKRRQPG